MDNNTLMLNVINGLKVLEQQFKTQFITINKRLDTLKKPKYKHQYKRLPQDFNTLNTQFNKLTKRLDTLTKNANTNIKDYTQDFNKPNTQFVTINKH